MDSSPVILPLLRLLTQNLNPSFPADGPPATWLPPFLPHANSWLLRLTLEASAPAPPQVCTPLLPSFPRVSVQMPVGRRLLTSTDTAGPSLVALATLSPTYSCMCLLSLQEVGLPLMFSVMSPGPMGAGGHCEGTPAASGVWWHLSYGWHGDRGSSVVSSL